MRVRIRPLQEDDARTSYIWRNDAEVWKYTGSAPNRTITIDDELLWIRTVINDKTSRRFAIIANGNYVGNIYLTGIHDRKAEYHIFIGSKAYMGKGVAKEASKLIIAFARESLDLKTIILEVRSEHVRAVQLYLSLGFKEIEEDEKHIYMELSL